MTSPIPMTFNISCIYASGFSSRA